MGSTPITGRGAWNLTAMAARADQGASAGLITMATIFAADTWSLPVSTTHILSSGVAGTMAANGSGLRLSTVRNIAAGWVFTLPAAALLSGSLYLLFHAIF